MLAAVEAALDYPEEVEEEVTADLAPRAHKLAHTLLEACDERAAAILVEGLEVVIAGKPNVGKSSLLNRLLNEQRAIVTDIPGTTRDIVRGDMMVDGVRVRLSDTAGIRDDADTVEQIGVDRARKAIQHADLVLLVLDASRPITQQDTDLLALASSRAHLVVRNKSDLPQAAGVPDGIAVSAKTGRVSRNSCAILPHTPVSPVKRCSPRRGICTWPGTPPTACWNAPSALLQAIRWTCAQYT
jgi:tRNA modification GTPase